MVFLGEEAGRVEGGHTAHARSGDGLAVDVVGDVASGIDAFDSRLGGTGLDDDVAAFFHFQLACEQGRGRGVADGDEDTVSLDFRGLARDGVLEAHTGNVLGKTVDGTDDFLDGTVPDDVDLRVLEQALLQDFFRAQGVAAVDQRDALGEVREEEGLFDGGVAAADHHNLFAAIEEAVAGGAGRNAEALIGALGFKAQPFGLCTGGDDDGLGQHFGAAVQRQAEGALRQVGLDHDVVDDLGADVFGLFLHLLHQPRTLNGLGKARIVFDIRGDGQLAARLEAGDHNRIERGAGGIDGGGPASRAGADNGDANSADVLGHGPYLEADSVWRYGAF